MSKFIFYFLFFASTYSSAVGVPKEIYVHSVEHLDQIVEQSNWTDGSNPILIWDRLKINIPYKADQALDALIFVRDNNFWILPSGKIVKMPLAYRQIFGGRGQLLLPIDQRKELLNEWFNPRFAKLKNTTAFFSLLKVTNRSPQISYFYDQLDMIQMQRQALLSEECWDSQSHHPIQLSCLSLFAKTSCAK